MGANKPIPMNKVFFGFLSTVAYLVFLHLAGLDGRLLHQAGWAAPANPLAQESIALHDYVLTASLKIACLDANLSGLTFCRRTKTLFGITNEPPRIVEMDTSGNCLRAIPLMGFVDTEGIAWLNGRRFAIIEEQQHILSVVAISDDTTSLNRSHVLHSLQVDMKARDNKGLEGIAYDGGTGRLYLVNEKRPRQVFSVGGLTRARQRLDIRLESDLLPRWWLMKDLSGLHFDAASHHLLLVSHESQCVFEVALDGRLVSQLELTKNSAGLPAGIPQAEGVATDEAGNLYIVSEPNMLYTFTRRDRAPI